MAASTNRLSVLFLVFVLAHSQVQARESKFFSKVTHFNTVATGDGIEEKKKTHVEIPVPPPEYSLAPSPAPAYVEKEYGYGLYGHDSDMLPPAKETFTPVTTTTTTPVTATDDKDNNSEEQFVHEQLSGESFQTGYTNNNNYNYNNNNNNNGYSNNDNYHDNNGYSNSENYYNKNGYGTERQGMSDTRYLENGKYNYNTNSKDRQTNGYANNYNTAAAFTSTYSTTSQPENYNPNVYSGNYKSNEYGTERQGMSDTRYMENGKYYYHVKSENSYLNGYEPEKAATGNYANYEENSSNSNEFDTTEEYYRKQGYQESQEVEEP